MRSFVFAAVAVLAFASSACANEPNQHGTHVAPRCIKGKPCGRICIAASDVCRGPPPQPHCITGVLCGDVCIPKGKTCHARH